MQYRLIKVVGEPGNSGEFNEKFRVHRYMNLEEPPQKGTYIIVNKELFYIRDIAINPRQNDGVIKDDIMYLFSTRGISRYEHTTEDGWTKLEDEYLSNGWNIINEVDPCHIVKFEVW